MQVLGTRRSRDSNYEVKIFKQVLIQDYTQRL